MKTNGLLQMEQRAKYVGGPFKELLKDIPHSTIISYSIYKGTDFYGASGGSMMANQIPWHLADARIVGFYESNIKYYDYEIELVMW